MKEFTCIVCGEKGIDRSGCGNRKFCSKECKNLYWGRMRNGGYKGFQSCKYNDGVSCISYKCKNCGWNPDVMQKRLEALV